MILRLAWMIGTIAFICAALAPGAIEAATYRMVIQSPPDVGGKCLDVPGGRLVIGMRVQMWDCNNGSAQTFVYDDQSQLLKIGDTCVVSWGRGDAEDSVGLGDCNGRAPKQWRMVAVKDYYQIVGINNRCLELRYGVKDNGAPLDIQYCAADRPWRLWALVQAPADVHAGEITCHTDHGTFSASHSRSTTAHSVSTGGSACTYTLTPSPQVQWTGVSITEQPRNGTFEKTGEYAFKYQPKAGFKGTDEYAVKVCGHDAQSSGCATITYHIIVN